MTGGGNDFYKIKSMETAYAGFIIKSEDSAMQKNNSVKIGILKLCTDTISTFRRKC